MKCRICKKELNGDKKRRNRYCDAKCKNEKSFWTSIGDVFYLIIEVFGSILTAI